MDGWRVLEDFSVKDHQYIAFELSDVISLCAPARCPSYAWNVAKVDIGRCVEILGTDGAVLEDTSRGGGPAIDAIVNSVMNLMKTVYAVSSCDRTSTNW